LALSDSSVNRPWTCRQCDCRRPRRLLSSCRGTTRTCAATRGSRWTPPETPAHWRRSTTTHLPDTHTCHAAKAYPWRTKSLKLVLGLGSLTSSSLQRSHH